MPSASEEIAARLRDGGEAVRIRGAGTKDWGRPISPEALDVSALDEVVSHDPGDFTAVLQAGVRLEEAQARFAEHDQMLALDPPPGGTIGGVVATADSGPLRYRYGAPRDLVIGITMALPDGTVAHGGGRVIKNVAGYDLPKLAAGSFGTLGVITEVCVRLHPRPTGTATAVLTSGDPAELQRIALDLHGRPLEADALDVGWDGSDGAVLVRFSGAAGTDRAAALGGETVTDDDELWAAQRAGQRGPVVLRVAGLPADLARVLQTASRHGATAVGRAGVGTTWLRLDDATPALIAAVRDELRPHPVVLTDGPAELRAAVDPWHVPEGPELELMRRVKERFDPEGRCNPGLFAGGI